MHAFHDHDREPANFGTSGFSNQAGRESLQLCQQDGDLSLVVDGVEVGTKPGKHRKRRRIEIDEFLGPLETPGARDDLAGLATHLEVDHPATVVAPAESQSRFFVPALKGFCHRQCDSWADVRTCSATCLADPPSAA